MRNCGSINRDQEDDPERHANATLRKFGHSRDGTWTPQVVVALAVTRQGIPVRSWVLPGNSTDTSTVETVRADLRGWSLGRAMFVADSGMNSQDNRKLLASRRFRRYLRVTEANQVRICVFTKIKPKSCKLPLFSISPNFMDFLPQKICLSLQFVVDNPVEKLF